MSPPIPIPPLHLSTILKEVKNTRLMWKLIREAGIQSDHIEDQKTLASLLDQGLASKDADGVVTLTPYREKRMKLSVTVKRFLKELTGQKWNT